MNTQVAQRLGECITDYFGSFRKAGVVGKGRTVIHHRYRKAQICPISAQRLRNMSSAQKNQSFFRPEITDISNAIHFPCHSSRSSIEDGLI